MVKWKLRSGKFIDGNIAVIDVQVVRLSESVVGLSRCSYWNFGDIEISNWWSLRLRLPRRSAWSLCRLSLRRWRVPLLEIVSVERSGFGRRRLLLADGFSMELFVRDGDWRSRFDSRSKVEWRRSLLAIAKTDFEIASPPLKIGNPAGRMSEMNHVTKSRNKSEKSFIYTCSLYLRVVCRNVCCWSRC